MTLLQFIGPKSGLNKSEFLLSPEYCRFIAHGDKVLANLFHEIGRRYRAGEASKDVYGHGYIPGSREQWAEGAGITIRQYDLRAMPRLKCYERTKDRTDGFLECETWLLPGTNKRAVWIKLVPGFLPDMPVGDIDWRALKRAAPWQHKKLKPSTKPKAQPEQVAHVEAPQAQQQVVVQAPAKAPRVALQDHDHVQPAPQDHVQMAVQEQDHAQAPAVDEPQMIVPKTKPAPITTTTTSTPRLRRWTPLRRKRQREINCHKFRMLDCIKEGLLQTASEHLAEIVARMRAPRISRKNALADLLHGGPVAHADLWLLNAATFEDRAACQAWLESDDDTFCPEPGSVLWVRRKRRPKPSKEAFAPNRQEHPPSLRYLIARLRAAALAAGYRPDRSAAA